VIKHLSNRRFNERGKMQKIIVILTLLLTPSSFQTANGQKHTSFVLPNSKLLRCKSSDCLQLWDPPQGDAVLPKQIRVDAKQGCIYGFTALYDKSYSVDEVASAIDERYGKWTLPNFKSPQMRLWRIESEKFAISLTVSGKQDEKRRFAEKGTIVVIYIAFGDASACSGQAE
jgi:hypothetical protein